MLSDRLFPRVIPRDRRVILQKLHLPQLGLSMEQGKILGWFKKEGDSFEFGDEIYEVETEKSVLPVEAKLSGTIARIAVQVGVDYPVGTVLAIVAEPGETLSQEQIEAALAEGQHEGASATPVAEQVAAPASTAEAPGTGTAERVRVIPRARALAEQLGVNLANVRGTGPNGTITVEDVQKAAQPAPAESGPKIRERRPLSKMARTQAAILTRSSQVPQATAVVLVDASSLVKRREVEGRAIQENHGIKPTYTDFILDAVIRSIGEVPEANASFKDDALILYEDINISIATATEFGLMAPVLHQAQELSLGDRALRLREIAQRARENKLTPQDLEGGTITVSNLGTSGVEFGTPLVTEPQAVILFAGTILNRPVAIGTTVEVRPTFYLDMAYDHRVLDGATTAKFITTVKRYLEAT